MRTTIASLAATIAIAASALAADRVTVAEPLMSVVTNVQRLREVCPSDGDFDACTRFVAFHLTASCSLHDDRWTIDASATFRPWILAYNLSSIPHEQLHIGDIRESTERYLDLMTAEPFASQSACEAGALAATQSFEQKMREFARRSNELRHRALLRAAR